MPSTPLRQRLRSSWQKLQQETEWHSQGVLIFEPKGARAQPSESESKTGPPYQPCCVEDRNAWRQRARRNGFLPDSTTTNRRSDRSETAITPGSDLFKRLPPELREQIYAAFFALLAQDRLTPAQLHPDRQKTSRLQDSYSKPLPPHEPPLCRASKLIRNESLPLFYSTWRFPLVVHLRPQMDYQVVSWYRRLHPYHLRKIRKLELYFCFDMAQRRLGRGRQGAVVYHVNLHEHSTDFAAIKVAGQPAKSLRLLNLETLHVQVLAAIQGVLKEHPLGTWSYDELERLIPEALSL